MLGGFAFSHLTNWACPVTPCLSWSSLMHVCMVGISLLSKHVCIMWKNKAGFPEEHIVRLNWNYIEPVTTPSVGLILFIKSCCYTHIKVIFLWNVANMQLFFRLKLVLVIDMYDQKCLKNNVHISSGQAVLCKTKIQPCHLTLCLCSNQRRALDIPSLLLQTAVVDKRLNLLV